MTIFVWKEVYVVGQVDADSSGESDDSESDFVKRRDRRGYIDTISNPAYFCFANHESEFGFENEVGDYPCVSSYS